MSKEPSETKQHPTIEMYGKIDQQIIEMIKSIYGVDERSVEISASQKQDHHSIGPIAQSVKINHNGKKLKLNTKTSEVKPDRVWMKLCETFLKKTLENLGYGPKFYALPFESNLFLQISEDVGQKLSGDECPKTPRQHSNTTIYHCVVADLVANVMCLQNALGNPNNISFKSKEGKLKPIITDFSFSLFSFDEEENQPESFTAKILKDKRKLTHDIEYQVHGDNMPLVEIALRRLQTGKKLPEDTKKKMSFNEAIEDAFIFTTKLAEDFAEKLQHDFDTASIDTSQFYKDTVLERFEQSIAIINNKLKTSVQPQQSPTHLEQEKLPTTSSRQ